MARRRVGEGGAVVGTRINDECDSSAEAVTGIALEMPGMPQSPTVRGVTVPPGIIAGATADRRRAAPRAWARSASPRGRG